MCIYKASDGAGGEGGIVITFGSQRSSIPVRRNVVHHPALNERLKTNYRERKSEYFCTVNVGYPDTELRRVPHVLKNRV